MTTPHAERRYALPASPFDDAGHRVSEALIRDVVDEFYSRVQRDELLGPVFDAHIEDWGPHLEKMKDFWSSVLRRTGRYSGNPLAAHMRVPEITLEHFNRWVDLFRETVEELCPPDEAEAFVFRSLRMRAAMSRALGLLTDF